MHNTMTVCQEGFSICHNLYQEASNSIAIVSYMMTIYFTKIDISKMVTTKSRCNYSSEKMMIPECFNMLIRGGMQCLDFNICLNSSHNDISNRLLTDLLYVCLDLILFTSTPFTSCVELQLSIEIISPLTSFESENLKGSGMSRSMAGNNFLYAYNHFSSYTSFSSMKDVLGWQLLLFVTSFLGVTYPYYPGNQGNTPITPVIDFVTPN